MGRYIASDTVKAFLETKVSFGSSDDQISDIELDLLIRQAESKVELELSDQYVIPFKGYENRTFHNILSGNTKDTISNLCLYRSLYNVMKFYFGKTSNNRGQNYVDFYADSFNDILEPLKRKRKTGVFDSPPLADLFINGNSQRFSPVLPSPQVSNCGVNSFLYANTHVNNPQIGPLIGYWNNGYWIASNNS